jgi:hypothetical protein
MLGGHSIVETQVAVAGPVAVPHILVPVALAVFVILPQNPAGTVTVELQGLLSPTASVPTVTVVSSAGLPGVPLLSTTVTPVRATLPQLVTMPLTG